MSAEIPKQFQGYNLVFGDGASSGNPGPGGWGSLVVWADGTVHEKGGAEPRTTNNRMELLAIIRALEALAGDAHPTAVFSDSTYVLWGISSWVWGWKRNGWRTARGSEVQNQDLWEALLRAVRGLAGRVSWNYVPGHRGYPGNERCDQIATALSRGEKVLLFQGSINDYPIPLQILPDDLSIPASAASVRKASSKAKAKKVWYLSFVGGRVERHEHWKQCEARVRGISGAKYQKVETYEQEVEIMKQWGVNQFS